MSLGAKTSSALSPLASAYVCVGVHACIYSTLRAIADPHVGAKSWKKMQMHTITETERLLGLGHTSATLLGPSPSHLF